MKVTERLDNPFLKLDCHGFLDYGRIHSQLSYQCWRAGKRSLGKRLLRALREKKSPRRPMCFNRYKVFLQLQSFQHRQPKDARR